MGDLLNLLPAARGPADRPRHPVNLPEDPTMRHPEKKWNYNVPPILESGGD